MKRVRHFLLSRLAWSLYWLLWKTWTIRVIEPNEMKAALQQRKTLILAHWHGQELALMPMIRRYRLATMTSTSADGRLMEYAVTKMSGSSSKGSSTRQGVQALLGLTRLMRSGLSSCIAVDGPKGPLNRVKPGVFELAKLTESTVFAVGAHVDRAWVFRRSWNQAILPKPFARLTIQFRSTGLDSVKEIDAKNPRLAEQLEQAIHAAVHDASQSAQP